MSKMVVNQYGGKQSFIEGDYTQLPFRAIRRLAITLQRGGKKYGRNNWKKIDCNDHLNHAIRHILLFAEFGDTEDLHNAFCRLAMVIDRSEVERIKTATRQQSDSRQRTIVMHLDADDLKEFFNVQIFLTSGMPISLCVETEALIEIKNAMEEDSILELQVEDTVHCIRSDDISLLIIQRA